MATLQWENDDLVLRLSGAEKLESVHGDLRVPAASVAGFEVLEDAYAPAGVRAGFKVGMRWPGMSAVAVVRRKGHKLFAVVHRDTPRGVRVTLRDTDYDEWIVGSEDPEGLVARLSART
jgi:hypothetical protein